MATLLDPRFKNLNFLNPAACGTAISKLKRLVEKEANSSGGSDESDQEPPETPDYSSQFWSHHIDVAHGKRKRRKDARLPNVPDHELMLYLKNPVTPLKTNPLESWDDMKAVFPVLQKIALEYLSIVATSVPSERLFSKAGATICRDRNRLLSKRLNKVLFLGTLKEEDWW